MKTKAEILESHIHPTKFLSSLSTETGKLAIFQAMDEHAQQISQEFAEWKFQNYKPVLKYGLLDFWRSKKVDSRKYTTSNLFAKFWAERGQG